MHVNHKLKGVKGLAMVFNPTLKEITESVTLPLYYTGLKNEALISEQEKEYEKVALDVGPNGWEVDVHVTLGPQQVTWFLVAATADAAHDEHDVVDKAGIAFGEEVMMGMEGQGDAERITLR